MGSASSCFLLQEALQKETQNGGGALDNVPPEQDELEAFEADRDGPQTAGTQRLKISQVRGN